MATENETVIPLGSLLNVNHSPIQGELVVGEGLQAYFALLVNEPPIRGFSSLLGHC
jgi:hypothetical protein